MESATPTVLWRMYRTGSPAPGAAAALGRSRAPGAAVRAIILPGGPPYTLALFTNDQMDRVENYDTMDVAIFRSDEIKRSLVEDGWWEP